MTREAQSEAKLRALIENGCLPATTCGRTFLKFVAPLLDGGVLAWQKSGAGRQLAVRDAKSLNDFCLQHFPVVDLPPDTRSRVVGVGRFRDTKAIANDEYEVISVRCWRNEALRKQGQPVGAAAATTEHGVFSFLLTPGCSYKLHGRCILVENPAVFVAVEHLELGADMVIYGGGRISRRVLDWLVGTTGADFSLLHLPDYDPVGLSEFARLHTRFGNRIILHLPADLEERFDQFSKAKLLKKLKSQALLARLRGSELPEIRSVVALIDRYNAGLEQEALLIQS